MTTYNFVNRRFERFAEAFDVYRDFLRLSKDEISSLSVCVMAKSMAALQEATRGTMLKEYSAYGWRAGSLEGILSEVPLHSVPGGKLRSGVWRLRWEEYQDLPNYDWDAKPFDSCSMTLTHADPKMSMKAVSEEEPLVCEQIRTAIEPLLGRDVKVHICGSNLFDINTNHYTFRLRDAFRVPAITALVRAFGLNDAVWSLELHGSQDFLEKSLPTAKIATEDYPDPLLDLRDSGYGRGTYTVAPATLMFPFTNCTLDEALTLGQQAEELGDDVTLVRLCRDYIPWKLGDTGAYPRTQLNVCQLWMLRGQLSIKVGINQYADEDPPVRAGVAEMRKIADRHGGRLKQGW